MMTSVSIQPCVTGNNNNNNNNNLASMDQQSNYHPPCCACQCLHPHCAQPPFLPCHMSHGVKHPPEPFQHPQKGDVDSQLTPVGICKSWAPTMPSTTPQIMAALSGMCLQCLVHTAAMLCLQLLTRVVPHTLVCTTPALTAPWPPPSASPPAPARCPPWCRLSSSPAHPQRA